MTNNIEIDKLANFLLKKINRAIRDYQMINDGERIAVAVSGGKDSLTLLKLLQKRLKRAKEKYELIAINVQSDYPCGDIEQKVLEELFQSLDIPYKFVEMKILDDKKSREPSCFWCSWNRRKTIFLKAHELGCKKVAFAHHLDDLAETTLMNLFYHSKLETMNPYLEMFDGEIIIIRPLIYILEKDIMRFAEMSNFPKSTYQCPNSITSKRAFIKNLLNEIEKQSPYVKINLFRAVTQYGDLGSVPKYDKEEQ